MLEWKAKTPPPKKRRFPAVAFHCTQVELQPHQSENLELKCKPVEEKKKRGHDYQRGHIGGKKGTRSDEGLGHDSFI